MHPLFSVTVFTGQQLVLEAIQRWLTRPCADAEAHRQRRLGLKGLVSLLIKTTATGVLATVLDAAIEFRRRQLLAAAAVDLDDASARPSRFPGLGMLSRAGIASWKARLLLCIDELERRAEAYGIESRHRFSPGKTVGEPAGKNAMAQLGDEEQPQRLGRTVEQLQELVKQGDSDSQRRLDDEVGSLVDLLLGTASLPATPAATDAGSGATRSHSVPAALDSLAGGRLRSIRSRAALAPEEGASPCTDLCQICMDRRVNVQVDGCHHPLCFGCARRLCASHDHSMPQCPFCRQAIEGFIPLPLVDAHNNAPAVPGGIAANVAAVRS